MVQQVIDRGTLVLNSSPRKTLVFRPYNPRDDELCHELYERFMVIKEEQKLPLIISETPYSISKKEKIDESGVLRKYSKTLFFTQLKTKNVFCGGILTPGMGYQPNESILVSNMEGRYQIYELDGVVLHEVTENIFKVRHHPYKKEPCAMAEYKIPGITELGEIILNGKLESKLDEWLESYKKIPATLCSECRGRLIE